MPKKRISRRLPDTPKYCLLDRRCPYRDQQTICDNPQINKGNSDSACHEMTNSRAFGLLSDRQDRHLNAKTGE